jgi:hypothetical protein
LRRRWIAYTLVGIAFGALDFYYLGGLHSRIPHGLFSWGPLGGSVDLIVRFGVLNVGLWLVPAVPVAIAEARRTGSALRAAAATIYLWCVAVLAYYVTNCAHLLLVGEPGRPEMHIANRAAEHWAANWARELRYTVVHSSAEWLVVAVVGGAVVGLLVGAIALRSAAGQARALEYSAKEWASPS